MTQPPHWVLYRTPSVNIKQVFFVFSAFIDIALRVLHMATLTPKSVCIFLVTVILLYFVPLICDQLTMVFFPNLHRYFYDHLDHRDMDHRDILMI